MGSRADLPPVPIHDTAIHAHGYGAVPVDLSDPRATEPLVDLSRAGLAGKNYYAIADGSNPPYGERLAGSLPVLLARQGVADRLLRVNRHLAAFGAELYLWDGYRGIATQAGLWAFAAGSFRAAHPEATEEAVEQHLHSYVSDPRAFDAADPTTWPTHSTGGAVDLTLRDLATGALLEMGAGFDQMDATAHTDFFERALRAGEIAPGDPRLANRRLLYMAMTAAGFVNYPKEFWHYDRGTQLAQWTRATLTGAPLAPAWYGYVPLPDGIAGA